MLPFPLVLACSRGPILSPWCWPRLDLEFMPCSGGARKFATRGKCRCCCPQTIKSVLQSGYFSLFRTWGLNCEPTFGGPSSYLQSHFLPSAPFLPHPFHSAPLEVGPLNPARRSGGRYKLPERGLGQSPSQN